MRATWIAHHDGGVDRHDGAWSHTETIGGNDVGAKQLPVSKDGCRRWVQLLRPYGFPAMPDATPTHRIARHMIVENIAVTPRPD